MDPWTTFWWGQYAGGHPAHSPNGVYFTPAHGNVPLPGYVDAGAWKPYAVPQVIPGTHSLVDGFRSRRYPELHPMLATDTSRVRYDLRVPPVEGIDQEPFSHGQVHFALSRQAPIMRLVSKEFPWQMDIQRGVNTSITCENIWHGLYLMLQEPIADSEWGMLCLPAFGGSKKREAVERAAERRRERMRARGDHKGSKDKTLKRIDFLGVDVVFRGLEKDDDYAKKRYFPTQDECEEVWIIKTAST